MISSSPTPEKPTAPRINALWLIAEKMISTVGLFLVSAFVARYIGPATVGVIALAVASFQIVLVISQFGSENIIIRRLSCSLDSGIALAKASLWMRALIYIIFAIPVLWYSYSENEIEFIFSGAVAIATFFTAVDLIATYNDTTLNSRINAVFNLCGLILALLVRYFIVEFELDILWLTVPIIITTGLPFALRVVHFYSRSQYANIKMKGRHFFYCRYLLVTGSAMFIANISVAIYPRMNIFFLSQLSHAEVLGVYSVAVTLSTAWSFIMIAVITSNFPAIYSEQDEKSVMLKTAQLSAFIIAVSLSVMLGFAALGKIFIAALYGPAFADVYVPVLILCGGTMLSTLGTVTSRVILKYAGYRYLSYKSLVTLVLCAPLSWYLIDAYGPIGASVSVVLLELISLTVLNYAWQRGKIIKIHLFILRWIFMSWQKWPLHIRKCQR
jgi:O-antigen/teichoic acid export membrane protein